MFEMML